MKHEPEKAAVAYLSGTMRSRRRARFEQHIVDCEDCWQEVQLGRTGRSLAESARELAPQDTRENIRAVIAAHPGSNKSWRVGWGMTMLVAAAAVIASAGYLSLRGPAQPPVIEAVLTDYREPARSSHVIEAELPRRLGDLRYLTSYPNPSVDPEEHEISEHGRFSHAWGRSRPANLFVTAGGRGSWA